MELVRSPANNPTDEMCAIAFDWQFLLETEFIYKYYALLNATYSLFMARNAYHYFRIIYIKLYAFVYPCHCFHCIDLSAHHCSEYSRSSWILIFTLSLWPYISFRPFYLSQCLYYGHSIVNTLLLVYYYIWNGHLE